MAKRSISNRTGDIKVINSITQQTTNNNNFYIKVIITVSIVIASLITGYYFVFNDSSEQPKQHVVHAGEGKG